MVVYDMIMTTILRRLRNTLEKIVSYFFSVHYDNCKVHMTGQTFSDFVKGFCNFTQIDTYLFCLLWILGTDSDKKHNFIFRA